MGRSGWIGIWILCFLGAANAPALARVAVCVSVVPQKHFVQQIGKDRVDVQVMVQPGASPATYEPRPRQMAALARTKLYFSIGVPFESAWLGKIAAANPGMQVVPTDQGIEKLAMAAHDHHGETAEAGSGTDHDHGGLDPHIWLSPPLVKIQAKTVLMALKAADPGHDEFYEANYQAFISSIENLDAELKDVFRGQEGMAFMVFHPSWGYFAKAYGLTQIPIEVQGKNPKPAQLEALIRHARETRIRVVFVQPQFSTKSATVIAREIGAEVVFADPLAEDWAANLREVTKKMAAALRPL